MLLSPINKTKGDMNKMDSLVQDALVSAGKTSDGLKVGEANIVVVGAGGAGNKLVSLLP